LSALVRCGQTLESTSAFAAQRATSLRQVAISHL
jgi:hypothetical protein